MTLDLINSPHARHSDKMRIARVQLAKENMEKLKNLPLAIVRRESFLKKDATTNDLRNSLKKRVL